MLSVEVDRVPGEHADIVRQARSWGDTQPQAEAPEGKCARLVVLSLTADPL